ncbi:MAG TPA: oligopeptide ABC transporter ATP-binding protein [Thermotogae bacterium]|nr:oligopeptide ABC transporter ATP-binding protein [Thermotogota bacterium]
MLELKDVSKIYRIGAFGRRKLLAVDRANFNIKDQTVVALVGESGSGKTTIGKMILKLISPTSGKIILDGEDITKIKRRRIKDYYLKVQGVFQDPFSSYNPIFKADRIFKMVHDSFFPEVPQNEWRKSVLKVIEQVGLNPDEVLNKFPHQLSGGQLQRFLIARALLMKVKLLVADEIISMLDASTRVDVLNLLVDLKKEGLSVLFITHDLSLGYYISDEVVIMYRGGVMEYGPTEEVFKNPIHPYTVSLLEAVPTFEKRWEEDIPAVSIEEEKATPVVQNESQMCKFYWRCNEADPEKCQSPGFKEITPGHFVACSRR